MASLDDDNDDQEGVTTEGYQCMNDGGGDDTRFCIEVSGTKLELGMDPQNTDIGHGAVVWEASVIFSKYLEHGSDKGLSLSKLKGKKVLELGCGPGLGGLSLMLFGCEVVFTDLPAVMDVVATANIERNYRNLMSQGSNGLELTKPHTFSLDWTDSTGMSTIKSVINNNEGFDVVLLCDCVFSELLVLDLVRNITEACGPKSVVYCVHEIRDESANEVFLRELSKAFTLKTIPKSKQHPEYTHPLVQLVVAKPRRGK